MQEEKQKSTTLTCALKIIKWFSSSKYTEEEKSKTLLDLNRFVKQMAQQGEDFQVLTRESSITCLRPLLLDSMLKTDIVAYFRRVMISVQVTQTYKRLNIPLIITRILEKDNRQMSGKMRQARREDSESRQCLKFIEKWTSISASTLPRLLVNSLVSFAQLPVLPPNPDPKRQYISVQEKKTAIEVLRNLSSKNPELCAWSGGISVLTNTITDPSLEQDKSPQEAMLTLLYLINQPNVRTKINLYLNLKRIFWIFTDIDYNPDTVKDRPNKAEVFKAQLDLGKKAVIKILKSWAGLIYLGNQMTTLRSFIQSLRQKIRPEVRAAIYQVLESVLMIGNSAARQRQSLNKLRIANLLNCYLITLVQLLIDCDLFKILVELSGLQDAQTTVPAQKFLKQLTILMFNSLPDSSKYIDFLISAATQSDQGSLSLKSCSSFVINKIGNYAFDGQQDRQSTKLLSQLQNMYMASSLYMSVAQASLSQTTRALSLLPQDSDTKVLYQSTAMTRSTKQDFAKWRWEVIEQILKHPQDAKTKARFENEKFHQHKIVKYLLRFYSPAKKQFSQLAWKMEHFKYVRVGQLFVKNIVNMPAFTALLNQPLPLQFQITISFMDELKQSLINLLNSADIRGVQPSFYLTLERELMCWLGLFSQNKRGFQDLLVTNQIFQLLERYIDKPNCDYILAVLLHYFDYNRQNYVKGLKEGKQVVIGPRDFLEKCILRGSRMLALQAIEVLKMLYRIEVIGYNSWGFRILAKLLRAQDLKHPELVQALMDAVQDLFLDHQNLPDFIQHISFPDLPKLRNALAPNFLISLLATDKGFAGIRSFLEDWLIAQYQTWIQRKNSQYNASMGSILDAALDFAEPKYQGYSLKQPNSPLELIYIYKLPWSATLDDQGFPLFVTSTRTGFTLQAQMSFKIVKPVRFMLQIGAMPVDEKLSQKSQGSGFELRPDQKMYYGKKQNGCVSMKKGGVHFYFAEKPNREKDVHTLIKIKVELRIRRSFDNAELPIHLIGQLAKTQAGVQFLRDMKTTETLVGSIRNPAANASQVKAALWALGHLGCSDLGMQLIKQHEVVNTVIQMAYSHSFISLRGTCRYILNMVCSSQEGRKEISKHGWITNRNSNIGWICAPGVSRRFFDIEKVEDNYWMANQSAWAVYNAALEPLNQSTPHLLLFTEEKKLFQSISMYSHLQGRTQARQLIKSNPELASSPKLIKNVLLLMTFYKFRLDLRRHILNLFDQFLRTSKFLGDPINSKIYVI